MDIIFCSNPLEPKRVDDDWLFEFNACARHGIQTHLLNYDELAQSNLPKAFKGIKNPGVTQRCIYRGWMMPVKMYELFYESMLASNLVLINTPDEYKECYYFPPAYPIIESCTPRTVITNVNYKPDRTELSKMLKPFGANPIIVKDYVKSQKHYWNEACFIPNASDIEHAQGVVNKFLDLQGEALQGGLIFREYVQLEKIGNHSKSNMPLTLEYRAFILNKKIVSVTRYWEDGTYLDHVVPIDLFKDIISDIESNFFTIDLAKKTNADWVIIELGDGQVAEYLDHENIDEFYGKINSMI